MGDKRGDVCGKLGECDFKFRVSRGGECGDDWVCF